MLTYVIAVVIMYGILSWIRRRTRIKDFHKKYVLITGCDSGFGNSLAQRLDLMGFNVFAACLKTPSVTRLQQLTSDRVKVFQMDVTNQEQVAAARVFIEHHIPKGTGLWGLVNNAGISGDIIGPPEWVPTEQYENVINVNIMGMVRVTNTFMDLVKVAKGRIINMASLAGRFPSPFGLPYSISKCGVEMFSDGLRLHLNNYGVSVHIIEPGAFRTPISAPDKLKKAVESGYQYASLKIKQEFGDSYVENLKKFVVDQLHNNADQDANKVVNVYIHALTACAPRIRYSLGKEKLTLHAILYLPSCIQEYLVGKVYAKSNLIPAAVKSSTDFGL